MIFTAGFPDMKRVFMVTAGLLIVSLLLPVDTSGSMSVIYIAAQAFLSAAALALALALAVRNSRGSRYFTDDLSVNVTVCAATCAGVQALYFDIPLAPLVFFVGFPHTVFARIRSLLWVPAAILFIASAGRYMFTSDPALFYWTAVFLLYSAALGYRMSRDWARIGILNSRLERFLSDAREVMGRIEEDGFSEVYDRIRGEEAARAITLDEDDFLQGMLAWGCRVFNARTGVLLVPDEGQMGFFRIRAAVHRGVQILEDLVPGDKGFIHITREREGILCVSDASSARHSLSFYPEDTPVGSFLVKIVWDSRWGTDADDGKDPEKIRCVLYFDSETAGGMSLDEATVKRLDEFGNLVLKAMTTAGRLQKLTKEVTSKDAISRCARGLTQSLNTDDIAQIALDAVVDAVPRCDGAVVMLFKEALFAVASHGVLDQQPGKERISRDEPSQAGLFLRRFAELDNGQDIHDTQIAEIVIDKKQSKRSPFFRRNEKLEDIVSFAIIPCCMTGVDDPLKAAIAVVSKEEYVFGKEELEELRTVASMTTPALDNAMQHEVIEKQSRTDGLTGLLNRRTFQIILDGKISNVTRGYFKSMAIIMVDGDRFKDVNDTYGHPVGDEVLVEIARRLKAGVRKNDAVARYGGEEFAIVLDNAGEKEAMEIAEKLRQSIRSKAFVTTAGKLKITASFGYSVMSGTEGVSNKEILEQADRALYHAKETGRDRVAGFHGMENSGVQFETVAAAAGEDKRW